MRCCGFVNRTCFPLTWMLNILWTLSCVMQKLFKLKVDKHLFFLYYISTRLLLKEKYILRGKSFWVNNTRLLFVKRYDRKKSMGNMIRFRKWKWDYSTKVTRNVKKTLNRPNFNATYFSVTFNIMLHSMS